MGNVKSIYLILYNMILAGGWTLVLVKAIEALRTSGPETCIEACIPALQVFQTLAILEIFHSLFGIVRSPLFSNIVQVFSRVFVLWAIVYSFPEVRTSVFGSSLCIAWALSEIIRYVFYALKEALGEAPYIVLWLRYTLFIVLYPVGAGSEVVLTVLALPFVAASKKFSYPMPNRLNFAFDFYPVACGVLFSYLYGFPFMYTHMLVQRKKALGPPKASPTKKQS
ncbi:3-hydroxyacyl-CoA dehydratase PASTICCINO 2 [Klebsormidium nitens]|uniref:Very-long-chain (3R)-3-hydroxyacyl-CoA dehydratase n=1 Tax=Klebsormidium nitens TaxID=105231 RepID=A0A0U9HI87_KLENI|nr:3-hydroxyacyl-CoA dehydratase PASTICCINO 2 [Klebsormidium nitens]|eukprot:GAQ80450.1 3-hydroxyacyl-CoA dehydratase PASTICCINO 2 [Klebsormidium nitens]